MIEPHGLMTPAEVARAFRVDAKTVSRWAAAGKLASTARVEQELPAPQPGPGPGPWPVDPRVCPRCHHRRSFEHDEVCS